tara:strand:- start:1341 stop:2132 length:792 start_codon:yes stop_codon:yes gene_type:complete
MKILLIIGDHPRHSFFAKHIIDRYPVSGVVIEKRENISPSSNNISINDKDNYIKHFKNRKFFEKKYFGTNIILTKSRTIEVENIEKEKNKVIHFIDIAKPDLVFLFGVSVLKPEILNALPVNVINLHAGLAPYYKGSACNFWPFYFLAPNYAGYTFHFAINKVDSGEVIHHSIPKLKYSQTIHEVSCEGLKTATKDVSLIIDTFIKNKYIPSSKISQQGKFFLNKDFHAHHLRIVYDIFQDNIVNYYLDNKDIFNEPKLIKLL